MKLYKVYEKSKEKNPSSHTLYYFLLNDSVDPKQHLEYVYWLDADLRTLKEETIPQGRFECSNLIDIHYILYNGEKIVCWNNNANVSYPEDLTWDRDIGGLIEDVERLKELEFEDRLKNK